MFLKHKFVSICDENSLTIAKQSSSHTITTEYGFSETHSKLDNILRSNYSQIVEGRKGHKKDIFIKRLKELKKVQVVLNDRYEAYLISMKKDLEGREIHN